MASKVEVRGQRIYAYLKEQPNTPHRKHEVLDALDLQDSHTTRRAIQRARELAEADDMYLTIPVFENGYTLAVTDDASAAVDPALWLARVEHGVRVPREIADDFMRSRMRDLAPIDRAYVRWQDKVRQATESITEGLDELVKANMEMRREQRRDSDREQSDA